MSLSRFRFDPEFCQIRPRSKGTFIRSMTNKQRENASVNTRHQTVIEVMPRSHKWMLLFAVKISLVTLSPCSIRVMSNYVIQTAV